MNRVELANQSLGRLAGGIAHDLNNVLAAIVGFANLLALGRAPDDPQLADLKQILASASRGAKLTRQLLV
jgi:two-component system cell cycle sensor histidine kinase/response regulator CckA